LILALGDSEALAAISAQMNPLQGGRCLEKSLHVQKIGSASAAAFAGAGTLPPGKAEKMHGFDMTFCASELSAARRPAASRFLILIMNHDVRCKARTLLTPFPWKAADALGRCDDYCVNSRHNV
jgi:hypothetical protein